MASTVAILFLALLVTGVATATVYASPIIQQATAAQTQNGDVTQPQAQRRLRDGTQSGEVTQTQAQLQLRECAQNYDGVGEGTCTCSQGDSDTALGETYQHRVCMQSGTCSRHGYGLSLTTEEVA